MASGGQPSLSLENESHLASCLLVPAAASTPIVAGWRGQQLVELLVSARGAGEGILLGMDECAVSRSRSRSSEPSWKPSLAPFVSSQPSFAPSKAGKSSPRSRRYDGMN
eukprot:scaffold9984_cov148-Skeletonema_dohrnii-CCMP3373.AAC.20